MTSSLNTLVKITGLKYVYEKTKHQHVAENEWRSKTCNEYMSKLGGWHKITRHSLASKGNNFCIQ